MARVLNGLTLNSPASPVSGTFGQTFTFQVTPTFSGTSTVTRYDVKFEVNPGSGYVTIASSGTVLTTSSTNPVSNTNGTGAISATVTLKIPGSYTIRASGAPTSGGSYTVTSSTQTVTVTVPALASTDSNQAQHDDAAALTQHNVTAQVDSVQTQTSDTVVVTYNAPTATVSMVDSSQAQTDDVPSIMPMPIVALGARGTAAKGAATDNTLTISPIVTIPANRGLLIAIAQDNIVGGTGINNEIVSVTDDAGNIWNNHDEYTNSPTGVPGDGCTAGLWGTFTRFQLTTSSVITITTSGNCAEKCCSLYEFDLTEGNAARFDTESDVHTEASNDFGSSAISGLSSINRLYFRALAKEANSAVDITPTSGFTAITPTRSRDDASAVLLRGEFKINTSTGETSNPTLAVTGDTASVFVAFSEKYFVQEVDSAQAQYDDAASLTQHNVLPITDSVQAQTDDAASLTQHNVLALLDSAQTQQSDTTGVTEHLTSSLSSVDSLQAQQSGTVLLTQHSILPATDSAQTQQSDQCSLTQHGQLVVADSAQTQSDDVSTLTVHPVLSPLDSVQNQQAEVTQLVLQGVMSSVDSVQVQHDDASVLTQHNVLSVSDSSQVQTLEATTLTFHQLLSVQGSQQIQYSESSAVVFHSLLSARESRQVQLSDTVAIFGGASPLSPTAEEHQLLVDLSWKSVMVESSSKMVDAGGHQPVIVDFPQRIVGVGDSQHAVAVDRSDH